MAKENYSGNTGIKNTIPSQYTSRTKHMPGSEKWHLNYIVYTL
jgi:hypothetical protein